MYISLFVNSVEIGILASARKLVVSNTGHFDLKILLMFKKNSHDNSEVFFNLLRFLVQIIINIIIIRSNTTGNNVGIVPVLGYPGYNLCPGSTRVILGMHTNTIVHSKYSY